MREAEPVWLAVDVLLTVMIAPPGHPVERAVVEEAAAGHIRPIIVQIALYYAMTAVKPSDRFDARRLAELVRYSEIDGDHGELRTKGAGYEPPSPEEIEHWREVALSPWE